MRTLKLLCTMLVNEGTQAYSADLSHFYLNSNLLQPAWIHIRFNQLTPAIIKTYNLERFRMRGYIACKVIKCMYGHPTSGRVAFLKLIEELRKHDYQQCPCQPALFTNKQKSIAFCVCVDDFFIVRGRGCIR